MNTMFDLIDAVAVDDVNNNKSQQQCLRGVAARRAKHNRLGTNRAHEMIGALPIPEYPLL